MIIQNDKWILFEIENVLTLNINSEFITVIYLNVKIIVTVEKYFTKFNNFFFEKQHQ